jgi:phytoene synthase
MGVGHYENFPVASVLLPAALRRPVAVIYKFARTADDFADEGEIAAEARLASLQAYREQLDRIERGVLPTDPLFAEIGAIARQYALPPQLFRDLLDAFSQDVRKTRYADFAEVTDYCRRSANPVGRLLLHLFDAATPVRLAQSDRICTSLQLINFWQDVPIDFANNRVYLPQDDLSRFGVTLDQIARQEVNGPWQNLMRFQIDRARAMMLDGSPLGRSLPGRIGLEIRTIVQGGLRILDKLERAGCDMFRHRPVLRAWDWPLLFARSL